MIRTSKAIQSKYRNNPVVTKRMEQAFTGRYIAINSALQYAANKFNFDNIACILVLQGIEPLVLGVMGFPGIVIVGFLNRRPRVTPTFRWLH